MVENQNDPKTQGSQTGQNQNQGNQNQAGNQKGNSPNEGGKSSSDDEETRGTKMPGRETTTPVAGKESRESNTNDKDQGGEATGDKKGSQSGNTQR